VEINMKFRRWTGLLLACLVPGAPTLAHHSITGVYDSTKKIEISGTASKVDWINPHIYVYLDVKDATGNVQTWKFESIPVAMARKAGLTKEKMMAPDQIVKVTGYPARNGTLRLAVMTRVDYPDGTFVMTVPELR
jgi:Family of unknown function (DUF6152)